MHMKKHEENPNFRHATILVACLHRPITLVWIFLVITKGFNMSDIV